MYRLKEVGLVLENVVANCTTHLVITSISGLTQRILEITVVIEAQIAKVMTADTGSTNIHQQMFGNCLPLWIRSKGRSYCICCNSVPQSDADQLCTFLTNNRDVFSLKEEEHDETAVVTIKIDTADEAH